MSGREASGRKGWQGELPGQGFRWEGDDPEELARVVDAAFDYRGNVTLLLCSGEEICGYVSNRDARAAEPYLEVFPRDGGPRRRVGYGELRAVVFSGRDTASGKSWETWVRAYRRKKAAEALGEKVAPINRYPDAGED